MNWAQRLKRGFQLDISQCAHCGGNVKIIANIEASYPPSHPRPENHFVSRKQVGSKR